MKSFLRQLPLSPKQMDCGKKVQLSSRELEESGVSPIHRPAGLLVESGVFSKEKTFRERQPDFVACLQCVTYLRTL
ncbi:hypothetical protein AMD24_00591 [Candidatus Xiphinematobacter sp. Idaho Grape]|nr:hypothetical protein AMD24_00591 [Candidatus Xiphinematobacter sp. Idaho Grape]